MIIEEEEEKEEKEDEEKEDIQKRRTMNDEEHHRQESGMEIDRQRPTDLTFSSHYGIFSWNQSITLVPQKEFHQHGKFGESHPCTGRRTVGPVP